MLTSLVKTISKSINIKFEITMNVKIHCYNILYQQ